jgi:RimJ/RimL family protein N-acetyltransferase
MIKARFKVTTMRLKPLFFLFLWLLSSVSLAQDFAVHVNFLDKINHKELQIEITTPRLIITTMGSDEGCFYKQLMQNENCFTSYSSGSLPCDDFIRNRLSDFSRQSLEGNPFSAYIVRLKPTKTQEVAPSIGWIDLSRHNHMVEISFMYHPSYWRQGYGREGAYAICKGFIPWLKDHHGELFDPNYKINEVSRLYAMIRPTNYASKKIFEALGFVRENVPFDFLSLNEEILYERDDSAH